MANAAIQKVIDEARSRYIKLAPRERVIVVVGSIVVLLTALYLGVIEPVANAHGSRVAALASSRALAAQLETAAAAVAAAGPKSGAAQVGRGMSLLAAIDQSTRNGTLAKPPASLQPEGDHEVKVRFEEVPFDSLVRWLAELQAKYGVSVQALDVEAQSGTGLVNVRMSLTRAS
ncbi:MAG: type secretion system protein [Hydrocarboniphaga sp.]|uniref:type II secretion system protein GspM n=1 Tax=Hydrocarboniphaga sp. TaxID=2033016 RepID=UPI002635EFB3|nr:type II secretion system protein GspM [Hydrocarboniphaga sp.]MDB5968071.1 type secretion system protein [Hydrocarboniphaga sp.]